MPGEKRGLPTTAAGAEFGLVLAFVILRAFDLLQLGLAVPSSISESPAPALDVFLVLGFTAWSAVFCTVLVRRRRFGDERWVWADVAVGAVILVATPWFTQPADRFSSWAAWGYAVTLSVAMGAGVGLRRWWQTLTAVGLLGGMYLAVTLPGATTGPQVLTTLTNSLAYPMFAVVIRFPAGYMRRLSADADASRALMASLAAEAERERHRLLLHDHASVLALLAQGDVPAAQLEAARAQAASGANRVRRFLADDPEPATTLAAALTEVTDEFPDLAPDLNVDQLTQELPEPLNAVVAGAVRTLLHNVRNHADAAHVVVYAATPPGLWEVQVSDDGIGFDTSTVVERFGLAHQVRGPISACGGDVEVTSGPGEGTIVRLSGSIP